MHYFISRHSNAKFKYHMPVDFQECISPTLEVLVEMCLKSELCLISAELVNGPAQQWKMLVTPMRKFPASPCPVHWRMC